MKNLLSLLLFLSSIASFAQIDFKTYDDWNEVLEVAEAEDKFIFLDAYTDWCYWCKVADKELFSQEKVGDFFNDNFIPVKINFEDSLGLVLSRKFRVWAYPTLLYFNPEGELVLKTAGYQADADKFIASSKEILEHKTGQRYGFSSKNLMPDFPDFYINSLVKGKSQASPSVETITAYLDEQEDKFSEESWSVMYRFSLGEKYEQFFIDNFDKYKSVFGKEETESMLYQTAYYGVVAAAEDKNEALMKKWSNIAADKMDNDEPKDIKDNLSMTYFQKTGEYEKYLAIAEEKINREDGLENHAFVNSVSWTAFENIEDKALLNKAASWMKTVVSNKPEYAYLDTYAALLLKSGDRKNGTKWAKKAIEIGKANGEKISDTEALLEKYGKKKRK